MPRRDVSCGTLSSVVAGFTSKSEMPWLGGRSISMDAGWLERPKRKRRRDKGSSKKWAPDGLWDRVPEYANVNDSDEGLGENPPVDSDRMTSAESSWMPMAHVPRVLAARIRDERPTRAWTRRGRMQPPRSVQVGAARGADLPVQPPCDRDATTPRMVAAAHGRTSVDFEAKGD